jgi:hypothetical protein
MTPQTSNKWSVICGGKEFILSQSQLDAIKKANKEGVGGIVWFNTFAISLSHISSITLIKKQVNTWNPNYEPENLPVISKEKINQLKEKAHQLVG